MLIRDNHRRPAEARPAADSGGASPLRRGLSRTRVLSGRGRRALVVAAVTVVGIAAAGSAGWYVASTAVEVSVDGEVRTTRTLANDVATVLAQLNVEVGDADRVEPGLLAPIENGIRVEVARAKTVILHLDDEAPRSVTAVMDTVADVLREAGAEELLDREARIDPRPESPIANGDRIEVDLPIAVTVVADDAEHQLQTYAGTIAEVLEDVGIEVGAADSVDPAVDHALREPGVITVRRVAVVEDVVDVSIERAEQQRETDELRTGETRVEVEGDDGLRRETYQVTLVDGDEEERELLAEEVVREPTARVVLVGTAPSEVEEAQGLLAELGYPVGSVDGIDGSQTRRALCAWRRLEGRAVSRQSLQPGELEALHATSGLPAADGAGRGVTVDRTCQVLYYRQDGIWQQVHAASTGADGLPREGSYTIQRTRAGWHTSTLYPAPTPNMYNTLYFRGAIALHGSNHVPTHPASKGCVRVTPASADQLFASLGVGDPVRVVGSY